MFASMKHMHKLLQVLLSAGLFSLLFALPSCKKNLKAGDGVAGASTTPRAIAYQLVWADEFNGPTGSGIDPEKCGSLPEEVRGLVLAVKAYERAAIEAALTGSAEYARKAMLLYPAIGEWEPSAELLHQFSMRSPDFPQFC